MFACTLIGALWLLIAISLNFPTADVMMMNAVTLLFQTALLSGCKPLVNELNTTTAASNETGKGFFFFFYALKDTSSKTYLIKAEGLSLQET